MARTLADLDTDIRFLFDLVGFENRHSQAAIFRRINTNYRIIRDKLTSAGSPLFLVTSEVVQSMGGRTTGYSGTLLSDAVMLTFSYVKAVMVKDGSSWLPLREAAREEFDYADGGERKGRPEAFCVQGVSVEAGVSEDTQHLGIVVWPSLDQARSFRVTGLREWVDLMTSTDAIVDNIGICDYLIAAVGVELTSRDDDEKLYLARMADRDRLEKEILRQATNRSPGNVRRVNVRRRLR